MNENLADVTTTSERSRRGITITMGTIKQSSYFPDKKDDPVTFEVSVDPDKITTSSKGVEVVRTYKPVKIIAPDLPQFRSSGNIMPRKRLDIPPYLESFAIDERVIPSIDWRAELRITILHPNPPEVSVVYQKEILTSRHHVQLINFDPVPIGKGKETVVFLQSTVFNGENYKSTDPNYDSDYAKKAAEFLKQEAQEILSQLPSQS
jgi:hypothetical protein